MRRRGTLIPTLVHESGDLDRVREFPSVFLEKCAEDLVDLSQVATIAVCQQVHHFLVVREQSFESRVLLRRIVVVPVHLALLATLCSLHCRLCIEDHLEPQSGVHTIASRKDTECSLAMSPTRKVGSLFESGAKLIDELSAEESMREFPKYLYLTSITISLQLSMLV